MLLERLRTGRIVSAPGIMPSSHTGTLPTSHPLIAELSSLRQQLHQYQRSAHQSAIQLQGARLELSLSKEEKGVLREQADNLRKEVQILRCAAAGASPKKRIDTLTPH